MKQIKQILKLLYFKRLKKAYKVKLLVGNFEEVWVYPSKKQFEWLYTFFKTNGYSKYNDDVWGAFEDDRFIWCMTNYENLSNWLKIKQQKPEPLHCHEKPKDIRPPETIEIIDELKDKTILSPTTSHR